MQWVREREFLVGNMMIPQPIPPSQNPSLSYLNKSGSRDKTNHLKSTICAHIFVSAACRPAERIIYLTLILHKLSSVWSWRSHNWHFASCVLVYFLQPKALGQIFKVCLEAPLQSIKKMHQALQKKCSCDITYFHLGTTSFFSIEFVTT